MLLFLTLAWEGVRGPVFLGKSPRREPGRVLLDLLLGVAGLGDGFSSSTEAGGCASFSARWEKAESIGRGDMSILGDDIMGD